MSEQGKDPMDRDPFEYIEKQAEQIAVLEGERDEAKRELHEAFRHPDFDQLLAKTILRAQRAESVLADVATALATAQSERDGAIKAQRRTIKDSAKSKSRAAELKHEIDRLHSWDGLMELLDEHWPEEFLPTIADNDKRDPGPRIVSLLRWTSALRKVIEDAPHDHYEPCGPTKYMVDQGASANELPNCTCWKSEVPE